jgi:hypothetical protein
MCVALRDLAEGTAVLSPRAAALPPPSARQRPPRLTESWFC